MLLVLYLWVYYLYFLAISNLVLFIEWSFTLSSQHIVSNISAQFLTLVVKDTDCVVKSIAGLIDFV
jgi:hypothetical protein